MEKKPALVKQKKLPRISECITFDNACVQSVGLIMIFHYYRAWCARKERICVKISGRRVREIQIV